MGNESEPLTAFLRQWASGDEAALDQLVQPLYTTLRRLAGKELASSYHSSISPSTLVHEAYVRLRNSPPAHCRDRVHFYALAARVMRFVLVDHLRAQLAAKRNVEVVTLTEPAVEIGAFNGASAAILDVNDALEALGKQHEQMARIVELRFFAGLSIEETAEAAGISASTVKRQWEFSRAWLKNWLTKRAA